ncbi:MAG: DUF4375 domain-containing protein [Bacillota bacterium]|nr:DUF4375 domain-containing protein [Bacillota bacterium]
MDIAVWLPVWEEIEKKSRAGAQLSNDERTWYLLRSAIDEVEENGLFGFFCGDYSALSEQVITAWQAVGADEMANIFEQGVAALPNQCAPQNEQEREALIEEFYDEDFRKIFNELDEDFEEILSDSEEMLDKLILRIIDNN